MATWNLEVEPVQRIAFLLASAELSDEICDAIQSQFGKLCYWGLSYPFDQTDYYKAEMGEGLVRRLIAFHGLVSPEQSVTDKIAAVALENRWTNPQAGRLFNLDIGYLDTDKLVLPSLKRGPRKVYAGQGVWLDMQFSYAKGRFEPMPWAFEDFKRIGYEKDLLKVREAYKKALLEWRQQKG